MAKQPFWLGHRGMRGKVLENTLPSFSYAKNLPVPIDGVEFDIQMTIDNQFVVYHDDNLARLCGQDINIDSLTLDETSKITLQNTNSTIASLSDMPVFLENYRHIELEVKTHSRTNAKQLCQNLVNFFDKNSEFLKLAITLTTFDRNLIEQFANHTLPFSHGLLIEDEFEINELITFAKHHHCVQIGFAEQFITAPIISLCHANNLKVCAWTVNDKNRAKELSCMGVDIIISDVADELVL